MCYKLLPALAMCLLHDTAAMVKPDFVSGGNIPKLEPEGDENLLDPYENALVINVTEEEKTAWQMKKAVNNFKCKINDMTINLLLGTDKVVPAADTITPEELRKNIGSFENIDWVHVGQHHFSDIDGRHQDRILGTPGGDLGEFVSGLAAFEDLNEVQLDLKNVTDYLISYLRHTTKVHFYYSTSDEALEWLTNATECGELDIANPSDRQKEKLLPLLVKPSAVGCLHFKNLLADPYEYRVRPEMVEHVIRAFHLIMWNKDLPERKKLAYILLDGEPFLERAWVNVYTSDICIDEGLAPLLYTRDSCVHWRTQYINHIQAVNVYRSQLASFFGEGDPPRTRSLNWVIREKGTIAFAKTATVAFKRPYPFFEVTLFWNQHKENTEVKVNDETGEKEIVVQAPDHIKYYPATRSVEESQTNLADATKLTVYHKKKLQKK